MKFSRMLLTATIITIISSASAFAAPSAKDSGLSESNAVQQQNKECEKGHCTAKKKGDCEEKLKDPIEMLQRKKQKVQELYDGGKITKEEADELIKRIDAKIREIQEFNSLPLDKKKEKLLAGFKEKVESKVKEGKLTKKEADELIKKFTERLKEWDGKGYPGYKSGKYREKGKGFFRKKQ
ncbi:MAG TPA: hypothetical protein PLA01_00550 [Acetivibrio sp.]|nr:hypothetical protein [Acetivibrio sp.]